MRVYSSELPVKTGKRIELVNITSKVGEAVRESKIREGLVNIFVPHTTTGLLINEDEPNLRRDIDEILERLVPLDAPYKHNRIDDNAHAHLRSILLSHFLTIPLAGGELKLGTWQSIMLCEFDGPRTRHVIIQVVGE